MEKVVKISTSGWQQKSLTDLKFGCSKVDKNTFLFETTYDDVLKQFSGDKLDE